MKDLPIAALLAPLLIAQGKWTRANTPVLPEPEGSRAGREGEGHHFKLLVLGDSAAAGVGVAHQEMALSGQLVALLKGDFYLDWELIATTGATTADVLALIPTIKQQAFDAIIISLGVNDITKGVTRKQWLRQQQVLVQELHSRFSTNKIIISQIPPMGSFEALPQPLRWCMGLQTGRFNGAARATWSGHPVCEFLELPFALTPALMASDKFHPGEGAYRIWAKSLAESLLEYKR